MRQTYYLIAFEGATQAIMKRPDGTMSDLHLRSPWENGLMRRAGLAVDAKRLLGVPVTALVAVFTVLPGGAS